MSDYIDHLVAKSLGVAYMLLPRPLSLFEPLQPTDPFASSYFPVEQEVAPGELSGGVAPRIDGAVPPAPEAELADEPSAQRSVPVIDYSASPSARLLTPPQPTSPAPVAGDAELGADRSRNVALDGSQTANGRPALSKHDPLRAAWQTPAPMGGQLTTAREETPLTPFHSAAPERAITPPESITPGVPPRTLLVAPAIVPRSDSDPEHGHPLSKRDEQMPSAPEAVRETAPAIKITIGRVDVRAVVAERPAPRLVPERRGVTLSLEDYLKQRSGGKQ